MITPTCIQIIVIISFLLCVNGLYLTKFLEQECHAMYEPNDSLLMTCLSEVDHVQYLISKNTTIGKRFAVLATSYNPKYAIFAPMSSLIWKAKIDYTPILLLILEKKHVHDYKISYIKQKMNEVGGLVFTMVVPEEMNGHTDSLAQIARIYAPATLPFHDDDYIMTSDVDMFPINYDYYHPKHDPSTSIANLYKNAYTDEDAMHAICYLGTLTKTWRDIVSTTHNITKPLLQITWKSYREDGAPIILPEHWERKHGAEKKWYLDQLFIYSMIKKSKIEQHGDNRYGGQRIDVNGWPGHPYGADVLQRMVDGTYKDSHVFKPLNTGNIARVTDLLILILKSGNVKNLEQHVKWINDYVQHMKEFGYL